MDAVLFSGNVKSANNAENYLQNHNEFFWDVGFNLEKNKYVFPILGYMHIPGRQVEYIVTIKDIIPFSLQHYQDREWKDDGENVTQFNWKSTLVITQIKPFSYDTHKFKKYSGGFIDNPPQGYIRVLPIEENPSVSGFTWIPIYREIAEALLPYENRQQELIELIRKMELEGLSVISIIDKNEQGDEIPLSEIDPFTFFSNWNRQISEDNRKAIIEKVQEFFGLRINPPKDFSGIPVVNNMSAWFFGWKKDRKPDDITHLWRIFNEVLSGNLSADTFNAVIKIRQIKYNITMGLFWIDPNNYLNLDRVNRDFLKLNNVNIESLDNFDTYQKYINETKKAFNKPFFEISYEAWQQQSKTPSMKVTESVTPYKISSKRYWLFAPGRNAKYWDEFYANGIMAMGDDALGDLRKYANKNSIAEQLRLIENAPKSSKKNDAMACYSIVHIMAIGDIVYAKSGRNKIVGWGEVSSDYLFDDTRPYYKHVRKVEWKATGNWAVSNENKFALKTLTDVTKYGQFVNYLNSLLGIKDIAPSTTQMQYWWLNANPTLWDLVSSPVGTRQTYTSHNKSGNKRRIYKHFQQVKPGDLLLGYVASPILQVVALLKVTKPLHNTPEGEVFEFEKVEQFQNPVSLKHLQNAPGLEKCEPLLNNQGSLFHLTKDEYDIILGMVDRDEKSQEKPHALSPLYSQEQCSADTGIPVARIKDWCDAIKRKGQAILYGPPGTGKTFIADRLARHIVGGSNGLKELIQFHPAYSYEEFIQGIRPETDDKGNLVYNLKPGRFLSFCEKARRMNSPCVLIIDEINRANLSHVFGELMYLLEYRAEEIPLTNGTHFSIPKNVQIIGTMNTADRSIALVDFALRRRFAFIELQPDYDLLKNFQAKRSFNAEPLVSLLQEINTKINDKNFYLGGSFFLVDDLPGQIEQIWKMEIETYLEEYFFTQPDTVNRFKWNIIRTRIGL